MQEARITFVVCAECGAEVDRVEYDAGREAPAVEAVAGALGIDNDEARKLVKRQNPGAERTGEQNARDLADAIAAGDVKGHPGKCPLGHKAGLTVQDDNPTPAVTTTIVKGDAR